MLLVRISVVNKTALNVLLPAYILLIWIHSELSPVSSFLFFLSQSDVPPGKVFFESKQVSEKRSPKTGPELGSPEFRISLVYNDTNLTL